MSLTIAVPNTNFENFVDIITPISFDFSKESLNNSGDISFIDKFIFLRSSTATVCNKNGILETVAANVPRYNYDPITKKFKGLLLEGNSINLLPYSATFNNWVFTESSKATAIVSPDGTANCSKIVGSTQNSEHSFSYNIGSQVSGRLMCSIFLKKGDYDHVALSLEGFNVPIELVYKFSTKSVVSRSGAVPWFEIEDASNGFIRLCFRGFADTPVGKTNFKVSLVDDNLNKVFAGDATKGTYVWGAQFENIGYSPSSYIPTEGTSVTRVADECTARISGMAGKTIGMITEIEKSVLQFAVNDAYSFIPVVNIRRNNNLYLDGSLSIYIDRASTNIVAASNFPSVTSRTNTGVSINNKKVKVCALFKNKEDSISANAFNSVTSITAEKPADLTQLRLGASAVLGGGAEYSSINIKNLRIFFIDLPASDLQKLSGI
ncbi:hypothetical protein ACG95P_19165 [Acinetobacter guillouiae]|uniref:phage head spike fiber domain-containing protein n=1 Tax=Acinetobacter guillouiae TaxID=106649 RepID=UPI003AF7FA74